MILGAGPTQQNPVDFTPPSPWGDNKFPLPQTGFYSNLRPFSTMRRMTSFPAWRPTPNGGPQPMPSLAPPPPPAAAMAPAPGPTPGGTHGSFGGSGFGSSGGTRAHSHVDPYMVMRQGVIPGVSPSGSNIRAGVTNAGQRVMRSMPFQSQALPPDMPAALPAAPMPMPTATHGFGAFSMNPLNWFRRQPTHPAHNPALVAIMRQNPHMVPTHPSMVKRVAANYPNCEKVGPRVDGTTWTICNGRVVQVEDQNGNVLQNAYENPGAY